MSQSTKRDVTKLNNENPVNRRIAGGVGLGGVLDAILSWRTNGLESAPGLTYGSSDPTKIKIVNATYVRVAGSLILVPAATETALESDGSHDITVSATLIKEAIYDISVTVAGVVTITRGVVATRPLAVAPPTPTGNVKIGELKIGVVAGSDSFDATTDNLNGDASFTYAFTDVTPGPGVALA